ncbi:hypothetical protein JVU11DRAFT_5594 [Chiua virens]|nr:hypothetical protein JVU11DRAFT_5594 [Chiua virens]
MLDAIGLALALRGHGWDWSHGVYIPRETRPANRRGFLFDVILSAALHALLCGVLHMAIRLLAPVQVRTLSGGSIFDEALPFRARYARSTVISIFGAFSLYAFLQMCYDACTIVGVLVLGQDPARWPPAFGAPWCATSLTDFWGRRWHQFFRRMFLIQGGYPLSFFLGKTGIVIGAFLSSGIMHHIAMVNLNERVTPWRMLVGFGMMAPGVLAERAFKKWTGRNVGGVAGWVWAMTWLVLWGSFIIDATARAGVYGGHLSAVERVIPGRKVVEGLMADLFERVIFS